MELFAEYIKERQGLELIQDYEGGFCSYRIVGRECYLADIYVSKGKRKIGQGGALLGEIIKQALKNNCELITANIHLKDPNANDTLKAAQACGFRVVACDQDVLLISKLITED